AAELIEYGRFAQGETPAQRVRELLCQGHGGLAPGQRLVRIAQIPQRPGVPAATRHPHVLPVEAMHQRVIHMIARLFHANVPSPPDTALTSVCQSGFLGTTTVGSSEAVMLALLAHKWNWKKQHQHNPQRSAKDQPYLIIGTHTHACFAKFARYFEVGV